MPRSVCHPLWKGAGRRRCAPSFPRSRTESRDTRGEEEGAEEALREAGRAPSTPGRQEETPGLPVATGAPAPQGAGVLVWVWSTRGLWHSGSQACSVRLSCAPTGRPRAALLGGWLTTSCGPRQARGTSSVPLGRPPSCPLLLQDSLPRARPCQPPLTGGLMGSGTSSQGVCVGGGFSSRLGGPQSGLCAGALGLGGGTHVCLSPGGHLASLRPWCGVAWRCQGSRPSGRPRQEVEGGGSQPRE